MGPLTNNEATIRVAQLSFSTGTNLIKAYIYTSNHSWMAQCAIGHALLPNMTKKRTVKRPANCTW